MRYRSISIPRAVATGRGSGSRRAPRVASDSAAGLERAIGRISPGVRRGPRGDRSTGGHWCRAVRSSAVRGDDAAGQRMAPSARRRRVVSVVLQVVYAIPLTLKLWESWSSESCVVALDNLRSGLGVFIHTGRQSEDQTRLGKSPIVSSFVMEALQEACTPGMTRSQRVGQV